MAEESSKESSTLKGKLDVKEGSSFTPASIAVKGRDLAIQYINILQWLPKYSKEDCVCDIIAGITIGLTMLPQSIAYALLAGLSPEYGLYSSFMGTLIYVIFGTVKEVSIGPTSLMALLTFEFTRDLPIDFVVLLTFLSGCVELLFGILRLGVLVDFISAPVVSGFTTATSIVIAEAQMKGLLGIKYKSVGFIDNLWKLFSNIHHTKLGDAILGVASIIFLLIFRKLKDIPVGKTVGKNRRASVVIETEMSGEFPDDDYDDNPVKPAIEDNKTLQKTLWFLTIGRNAITVLFAGILAYVFENNWGKAPFTLSGQIQPGFPSFSPPPFSTTHRNETYYFGEMVTELRSGIFIIPVVSVLANVAIAKAYSTGGRLYATQEMLTLGLCNLAGSFVSSMPTCGAFTRSAVSSASGVRTPLAGLYTGTLIILALGFLTPYFYYIPRSTLSAVLICAVAFMADFKIFRTLWRTSKRDFTAAMVTFVVSLGISIEVGLLLGVAVNCSFLLYLWARPEINVDHRKVSSDHEYLLVTPDGGLFFPSIEFVRAEVCRIAVSEGGGVLPLVLNCSHLKGLDFSAAEGIIHIQSEFRHRQQSFVLLNLKEEPKNLLEKRGKETIIYCNNQNDLESILFGDKEDVLLENTRKILEGEVNIPLLERKLVLEQADEKSDKKSVQ